MIPRSSIAGLACLALLSSFEQILCFAAAAPAPRLEADRPRYYFPRHVKRIVTNGTLTRSSTPAVEAEKSTSLAEASTQSPSTSHSLTPSESLASSLESLLSSLIPAGALDGNRFAQTTPINPVSLSSADSSGVSAASVNSASVSLSITPAVAASITRASVTPPLLNVVALSSDTPLRTASTLSGSLGSTDLPSGSISQASGTTLTPSATPALPVESERLIISGTNSGASGTSANLVSQATASGSDRTTSPRTKNLVGVLDTESSLVESRVENSTQTLPSASQSATSGSQSSGDLKSEDKKTGGSSFQSSLFTTGSALRSSATEFEASVTPLPTTLSFSSGTSAPSQDRLTDLISSLSRAASRDINGLAKTSGNATATSQPQSTGSTTGAQSKLTESLSSGDSERATDSVPVSSAGVTSLTGTFKATQTPSSPLSVSSAASVATQDATSRRTPGVQNNATEISFALFGENTVISSTLTKSLSPSGISSSDIKISATESATQERDSFASNSNGASARVSETFTRGANVSTTAIVPGKTNIALRPGVELLDSDASVLPGQTASVSATASRNTETSRRSSSELSEPRPSITTGATTSVGAGILGATRTANASSSVLSEPSGSFATGATKPIAVPVVGKTNTAQRESFVQSQASASVSNGESGSAPVATSPLSSDTETVKPTVSSSAGGTAPFPAIIPGPTKASGAINSLVSDSDLPASSLLDSASSTRLAISEKSITSGLSVSVASEPNVSASSFRTPSVPVAASVPEASDSSKPTSDRARTTPSPSAPVDPSTFTPSSISQESNRLESDVPEGASARLSKSTSIPQSSPIVGVLPEISDLPRLGPFISGTTRSTDLDSTRTDDTEPPTATESSRPAIDLSENVPTVSPSGGARLINLKSLTTAGTESATKAPSVPSVTVSPVVETSPVALAEQTDLTPGKASSTVDLSDGLPLLVPSVTGLNPSIKPSSAVQPDASNEIVSATSELPNGPVVLVPSETRLSSQTPVPSSLTDALPVVEPSRASESGSSPARTSQSSDGPTNLVPSVTRTPPLLPLSSATDLPPLNEPSRASETGSSAGISQSSDGPPILRPVATDVLSSIEPSRASETGSSAGISQSSDGPPILRPVATDVLSSIEPSRASETGSSAGISQSSDGPPILLPVATDLLSSFEPSGATQTGSATREVPLPSVSPIANSPLVIEPSQTDLVSEKPASASDILGGIPVPAPSATNPQPLSEPSAATQTYSASVSATPGEVQSSNVLPLPIPINTGVATATEDVPPIVISPRPSVSATPGEVQSSNVLPLPIPINTGVATATEDVPPIVISPRPSVSATSGEVQSSNILPLPIPINTGVATATEDVPPIVISPGPSLPEISSSVPATLTNIPTASAAVLPVVTPGPLTTGDIPVEPLKSITASDDKPTVTYDRITPSAPSDTGLPLIIPEISKTADLAPIQSVSATASDKVVPFISDIPPVLNALSSVTDAPSPLSSGISGESITISPVAPLTTGEPVKSGANLPSGTFSQPSDTAIVPIPIDQSTLTASVTKKESDVPASTGGIPPIIILPSSGPASGSFESTAPARTGSQLPATATPGAASGTTGGSSAPILVGISDILTASPSISGISGYPSPSQTDRISVAQSSGIIVEPSGVSPSAGSVPTGVSAGSTSAVNVGINISKPTATASYSNVLLNAEGSGASGSQAATITSALETSNGNLPSGEATAASPVETSKVVSGSGISAGPDNVTPVQASAQSATTAGEQAKLGTQSGSVQSTGAPEVVSGQVSETGAIGALTSSAAVNSVAPSVANAAGSVNLETKTNILPPSAAISAPSTITPIKENINSELISRKGTNVAAATGTDTMTAQPVGSNIIAEPSASMPTRSADFPPTGIPSSVPRIISPPEGVPVAPDNTTLCQIGFLYPLNYKFVLAHPQSQRQIFKYLPQGIAYGLGIPVENVTMQTLRAYDTTEDLKYITTLALFFIPSQQMDTLQLGLHTPTHKIYLNPDAPVNTTMSMINPAIPLKGDNSLGTPSAPGSGNDDSSTSNGSDVINEGVPIAGVDNSSPVRAKSVGIAAGVVCGAAAYGAAMFFVARRYRKRKQSHRRSPSMLSSPVLSGVSHDYMGVANSALMSGGRGDGDRSLTPHNGYYYERNSRGSGHSGSTGRQQISAPVMAENSLGWN